MNATKRTAAQVILQAAGALGETFSEWDLAVAAWALDRERFGMRGYHLAHPDTKRIAMEIMGRKPQNPIILGFMERVAPNTYRVTDLGRAELARLGGGVDDYSLIREVLDRPEFLRWRETQQRPPSPAPARLAEWLAAFRRNAGKFVAGPPYRREPITPDQIGEGLAFLEMLANGTGKCGRRKAVAG